MSPLQYGELPAEHEVLEDKIVAAAKEADKRDEPQERQVEHGLELYQVSGRAIVASC